jgi:flagellar biosynthesis protein FliQ
VMRIACYLLGIATALIFGIPLMLVIVSMLVSSSVVVLCVSLFVGLGISALVARTSIIERVVNFDMFVSPRIRLVDR